VNVRVIVPNTAIYSQVVKNYSFNDTRRNSRRPSVVQEGGLLGLCHDLQRRLKEQWENSGCHLPYPQREVHLYRVGGGD